MARILSEHTEDKMFGNIFVSLCLSAASCLGCRRTTLGGESSEQLGKRSASRGRSLSPHCDFIELPFEVPRSLFGTRGGTASSPGMQAVPSTQHIPTTVILSGPVAGAEHRGRCRRVGLSISESRRMACGVWPLGLWTLAVWRYLICARKVGVPRKPGHQPSLGPQPPARVPLVPRGDLL